MFLKLLLSHLENKCASIVSIFYYLYAHSDQPKILPFEVNEEKIVSTSGKKHFFTCFFSKSIISTLFAASALKMIVFSPLEHMQRSLISLHLTVLINVRMSVLSAVRDMAVIVLSTNISVLWAVP